MRQNEERRVTPDRRVHEYVQVETCSAKMGALENQLDDLAHILKGNGSKGLVKEVDSIGRDIATLVATDKERQRQHQMNTNRLNIIIAILVMLAAYVGIIVPLLPKHQSQLDPPKIFHSNQQNSVVSSTQPQTSDLPSTYQK